MKIKFILFALCLPTVLIFSFTVKNEIGPCYLSFNTSGSLTAAPADRLPEGHEKSRMLPIENGEVEISQVDGYRILYNNVNKAPFVNLKVELSDKKSYAADQKNLLTHFSYLNSHSTGMETKDLIEMEVNGYKIYGLSRNSIEAGSTLGTFVCFPGDNTVVYFYFNNLKPQYRNFESLEDYKRQRDAFIDEYTKHLTACKGK